MALQPLDQIGVPLIAFLAGGVDVGEDRAHRVDERQQISRDLRTQIEGALTKAAEQRLTHVGDRLESTEGQKTARAFDRVNGAEDLREDLAIGRVLLEGHQILVELVEVLDALSQELGDNVVHPTHSRLLLIDHGGLQTRIRRHTLTIQNSSC